MNKRKILKLIIDIVLMAIALSVAEELTLKVIKSESFWLEMGIYLVLYCIVFGAKRWIVYLWNRRRKNYEKNK